jgi:hypothetical protein
MLPLSGSSSSLKDLKVDVSYLASEKERHRKNIKRAAWKSINIDLKLTQNWEGCDRVHVTCHEVFVKT